MYKSALCHLHSSFGGMGRKASIAGFCYEAAKYGVDIVWLSDHDGRLEIMKNDPFEKYDFSKGNPTDVLNEKGKPKEHHWEEVDTTARNWELQPKSEEKHFILETQSNTEQFQGGSIRLKTISGTSERPLFTKPAFILGLKTNINCDDEDGRLIIRVPLSQQPPEHKMVVLTYVLGKPLTNEKFLPLTFNQNGDIELPLGEDAQKLGYTLDNTVQSLDIRLESRNNRQVSASLDKLELTTKIRAPEKWAQLQRELGEEIGKKYGVTVLANYEISHGERHMNYYGPPIPIYPYNGTKPSMEEMSAYAHKHGGIVSFNHPFYDLKYYGLDKDNRLEPEKEIQIIADNIIQRRASGATLIEVGFPAGGYELELCHNMQLWDLLNLAGLRIYGIGVSDAHCNMTWDKGSNYANYIASPDCTYENLVAGMKEGNLYMAEPARFQGKVRVFTDQGKTMGDTQTDGETITISLTKVPPESTLVWVLDGQKYKEEQVTGTCKSSISLNEGKHFVRAELYGADGRGILLTNPVWLSEK